MLKKILCGATLLCAAGFTSAATIEQESVVSTMPTDFQTVIAFDLFDDMGGTRTLESVTFSIDGMVTGNARVESEDAQAATINTTLEAELTLTDAMMNELVVTIPTITNVFNATAFDGDIDFMGSSGISYTDLMASQFEQEMYTDAATLAFFTGMGTTDFGFDASATSRATGAGNITSSFNSNAGGTVRVIYEFSETPSSVSTPSHVALLGLGLLAFAGLRKVRK